MKNLPIIIGVIIILVLGIGGYMYMQRSSSGSMGLDSFMPNQQTNSGMMSLKDLMTLGRDNMCTFSSSDENGTISGTTYVSGQNIRSDFSGTHADGEAYEGHTIMDGSYMYTWTTSAEPGFKMAMTQDYENMMEESKEFESDDSSQEQLDINKKVDYNCSRWSKDASMFVPPADIEFNDFSEQLKMMQDVMQDQNAPQESMETMDNKCAACDAVPADAQAACKQALGC